MTAKVFLSLSNKAIVLTTMCLLLSNTYAMEKLPNDKQLAPNDEEVTVLTQYEVKKGYKKKFRKLLRKYVRQAIADKSNIMAEAYYEQENSSILWVIERWDSKSGLEKRRNGAKFKLIKSLSEKKLIQPAKTIYVKDPGAYLKNSMEKSAREEDKPITIMLFVDSKAGTEGTFKEVYPYCYAAIQK